MVGGWWVVVRGGGWWCAVVGGIQTALEQHQHSSQTVLKQHPSSTQTALKQPPNNTKHPDSVTQHPNSTQTARKQHKNTLPGPTCCPVGGGGGLLRLVGRVCWWVVGGGWPAAGCWLLVAGCWLLAAGSWLPVGAAGVAQRVDPAAPLRAGEAPGRVRRAILPFTRSECGL